MYMFSWGWMGGFQMEIRAEGLQLQICKYQ